MSALVLGGSLAALVVGLILVSRVNVSVDEAWFLQVVERVRHGERLYDDVFFGAGPLPVWLACAAARRGRPDCITLRRLAVVLYAATVLALLAGLARVGADDALLAGATIAFVGLTGPIWPIDNHYGMIARLGVSMTALAWVEVGRAPTPGWAALGAAGTAMALLSKPTLGLVTFVAMTALLVAHDDGTAPVLIYLGGVGVAVIACLGLLRARGNFDGYVQRGFANKRSFIRTGRYGLGAAIRDSIPRRGMPRYLQRTLAVRLVSVGLFLSLAVCALLAAATPMIDRRGEVAAGAVGLLVAAVAAGVVPRADGEHIHSLTSLTIAALATTAIIARHITGARIDLVGAAALAGTGAIGFVAALTDRHVHRSPDPSPVSAHFRGVPFMWPAPSTARAPDDRVRELTGGRVFLLMDDAPLWYLACGLTNPTPFDYPLASVFSQRDTDNVIESLLSGSVEWCCHEPSSRHRLAPEALGAFVPSAMIRVADTNLGTLYRSPAR